MSTVQLHRVLRATPERIYRAFIDADAYELEEVEIFGAAGLPEGHLDRHPFGRIPAFTHGKFTLYETVAITR